MRKIIFALLILFSSIYAQNNLLLNTHIRMIPKIMALDMKLVAKSGSEKIQLAIVYDDDRKKIATEIASEINRYYNNKIGSITFIAFPLSSNELIDHRDISFIYTIALSTYSLKKVALWGIRNSVPTFSDNMDGLEEGILGSIAIERSTVIYLSKSVLKEGKFRFNDSLFQIARLVE